MEKGKKMKDILLKRNKLKNNAMQLRSLKFDSSVSNEQSIELNKQQDKLWKKYLFYENFIKAYYRTYLIYILQLYQ